MEDHHAKIHNRAGDSRSREVVHAGTTGYLTEVLRSAEPMGPKIQWVQSYITDDKIYCVYIAPNEEMVREHARQGGFPANNVEAIKSVIDPITAEG